MESYILFGLSNLFIEYIAILEKAITSKIDMSEKRGSRIILAESVPQQVSILANLSTLEHFFCSTVISIFKGINCGDSELTENQSVGSQQLEFDSCVTVIQQASAQLRSKFFQQFIDRVLTSEVCIRTHEIFVDGDTCSGLDNGLMPSAVFQVLFYSSRKESRTYDLAFQHLWSTDTDSNEKVEIREKARIFISSFNLSCSHTVPFFSCVRCCFWN